MSLQIASPFEQFFDRDGSPLDNGFVYIGTVNQNPETNPLTVYFDDALTIPAAQPLRTSNGYIVRNGSPARVYTSQEDFSLTVRDKSNVLVFTVADATSLSNLASDLAAASGSSLVGFVQSGGGAVVTTVQGKLRQSISAADFGAAGDGVTDDTAEFASLEAEFTGRAVDLLGGSYVVSALPVANFYFNGNFIVSGQTLKMPNWSAFFAAPQGDLGGTDTPYGGGVIPLPTTAGRTTVDELLVMTSQNCRSEFVRAVNIGSIYCWAKGNVSGNYSSRQSLAWVPQSVNIASEECWVWGGFRGANLSSIFSGCENESNSNISSRRAYASGRHSANVSSVDSYAGRGGGARFTVTTTGGAVTGITIDDAGSGYAVLDAIRFSDRSGPGAGATAEVASVDGTGGITGVTITLGGSNYSTRVDATVDNGTGDFSATLATDRAVVGGELSASIATTQCETSGDGAAVIASASSTASGLNSVVLGAQFCSAAGQNSVVLGGSGSSAASGDLAVVIGGNISEAQGIGSVIFGRRTINNVARSIAFGDNASGVASTANRKFHLFANGDMSIAGTLTQSAIFTDYAEYFENASVGTIALGTLMALDGRKVRPASAGDHVLGVVSATASVAAGDSPFSWSKRYLTGEFGEMLYHDIPDPDWPEFVPDPSWIKGDDDLEVNRPMVRNQVPAPLVSVPVENPDYDPTRENVPRSERPEEWTCVGLLGQIHTRLDATVAAGDFVNPADGGIGTKSDEPTNIRCMEIRSAHDGSKGYAVGLCLVK